MAVTYLITRTKDRKFGVYVRALSGVSLSILSYKMPELDTLLWPVRKMPVNFGVTKEFKPSIGAIAVSSGRLVKKNTEQAAKDYVKKLKSEAEEKQVERLQKINLKPVTKDFECIKLQYFRFVRSYKGVKFSPFTTQNKDKVESLAVSYANDGITTSIKPTVARTVATTKDNSNKLKSIGEVKPAIPTGLKGMMKPIKEQAPEFIRRIQGRRKRSTTLAFWSNR
jgi:hypothetical protein